MSQMGMQNSETQVKTGWMLETHGPGYSLDSQIWGCPRSLWPVACTPCAPLQAQSLTVLNCGLTPQGYASP